MIPAEIKGIDHVVLRVSDLDRALAFYTGVLGLTLERVLEPIRLHQMRCGRNLIDLMPLAPGEALPPPGQGSIDHLCLSLRGDLEAILAALEAHGIRPASPPSVVYGAGGFGSSVYITDPDGHTLELKVHYAEWPARHGAAPAAGSDR